MINRLLLEGIVVYCCVVVLGSSATYRCCTLGTGNTTQQNILAHEDLFERYFGDFDAATISPWNQFTTRCCTLFRSICGLEHYTSTGHNSVLGLMVWHFPGKSEACAYMCKQMLFARVQPSFQDECCPARVLRKESDDE